MILAAALVVFIEYVKGVPSAHVRAQIVAVKIHNKNCEIGRYIRLCCLEKWSFGIKARPTIVKSASLQPLSL